MGYFWECSSQKSELSVGSCSLKSESCKFSPYVSLVGLFSSLFTVSFLSDFVSFAKCTVFVLCGLSECVL